MADSLPEVNWTEFKQFVTNRSLSIQYVHYNDMYVLRAFDNSFGLECRIPYNNSNSDTADFEANFKANGNVGTFYRNKIHDGAGNALTSTLNGSKRSLDVNVSGGAGMATYVDAASITPSTDKAQVIAGLDRNAVKARMLSVTADGRIKIATEPPSAPGGATPVDVVADSIIATTEDTTYTITNGKTLTIQNFNGGGASSNNGDTIELFYDPNGNATGMTLIRVAYVPDTGGNFSFDLKATFVGNGTRRILVRRTRGAGSSARVSAFWAGYEE